MGIALARCKALLELPTSAPTAVTDEDDVSDAHYKPKFPSLRHGNFEANLGAVHLNFEDLHRVHHSKREQ